MLVGLRDILEQAAVGPDGNVAKEGEELLAVLVPLFSLDGLELRLTILLAAEDRHEVCARGSICNVVETVLEQLLLLRTITPFQVSATLHGGPGGDGGGERVAVRHLAEEPPTKVLGSAVGNAKDEVRYVVFAHVLLLVH